MRKIIACEGCKKQPAEVAACQIRVMNFEVFNEKCPREVEVNGV
jgi:hypothetical protein